MSITERRTVFAARKAGTLPLLAVALSLIACALPVRAQEAASDPLPSWNDGAVKQAILAFVQTVDFMRIVSNDLYGIPPPQVIGTSFYLQPQMQNGKMVLVRLPKIRTLNDKAQKPVNIALAIGTRPLFAAGNVRSGGDIAMCTYSKGRSGPSFQLIINHDDAAREYAYQEKDNATLNAAKKYGFTVVSMKSTGAPCSDQTRRNHSALRGTQAGPRRSGRKAGGAR
jgi:hypothetical protein